MAWTCTMCCHEGACRLHLEEIPWSIVDSHESPGGLGETGMSCIAPAITNATFAATGTRSRKLPVADQLKRA